EELELRVKAAFLFNFAKFTTWPAEKVAAPDAPLYLCVQGSDAMGGVLQETVRGRAIAGHAVEVLQAARAEALRDCHVVYVSAGDDARIATELSSLSSHGVLTVHEASEAQPAGVIRFFLSDGGRVRFEVNVMAASREQLALSAKLLEVSRVVSR
ncbi:MAG: YfiR family protein, partial [Nevskiaceae bacterium]